MSAATQACSDGKEQLMLSEKGPIFGNLLPFTRNELHKFDYRCYKTREFGL